MSGMKSNKELYKEVFSKLRASETVIMEEENMKNAKSRFRCSRLIAVCVSAALLLGATSGIAWAATDGATANPVRALRIFINGEEYGTYDKDSVTRNDDGSYTIHLKEGDTADVEAENGGEEASSVRASVSQNSGGLNTELNVSEDGSAEAVISDEDGKKSSESGGNSPEK